ncbi:MAG: hypothetical protein JSV49_09720 [Thermoplasmata archaeon]|nr:MAG: hypothetical protein JSV49_09720 [Thermoplasmata archaeon]
MKEIDLIFNVRALDNQGVSESSTLETKNLDEAILTCQSLLNDHQKKWIIIGYCDNEDEDE